MPRYFFHYYNSDVLCDEVGEELAGVEAANEAARRAAGELISDQISRGEKVDLAHRIEVESDDGIVIVIQFRDLFTGPVG